MSYGQVEVEDTNLDETAVTSHYRLLWLSSMLFRFCNALQSFQRTLDVISSPGNSQFALVLLDDIIVFSRSAEERIRQSRLISSLLQRARVLFTLKKCKVFTKKIGFLGNVICPTRLNLAACKTYPMHNVEPPRTLTKLKYFLVLWNIYWRFAPNFAQIATLHNAKLKRGKRKKSKTCWLSKWTP